MVDGVFTYGVTGDSCECSGEVVAVGKGSDSDFIGKYGVVIAVGLSLVIGRDCDESMLNGEFGCCEGDVVVRVVNCALVDGVFTYGFASDACGCSGECV